MSSMFMQQWFRLLSGTAWDAHDARQFNSETQDYLALLSLGEQKKRERTTSSVASQNNGANARAGILSEYDVAIVALQTMKSHPELLLLPAPGRFEHERGSAKNADFLVLDMEKHEVTGMQVKTSVRDDQYGQYDSNFVFLVDAKIDLGDALAKRVPGKTTLKSVSQPGLIAAHHMSKWPKQMNLQSHPWLRSYLGNENQFMSLKFYANWLTHNTKDTTPIARQRIGERTLHHLYRRPAA